MTVERKIDVGTIIQGLIILVAMISFALTLRADLDSVNKRTDRIEQAIISQQRETEELVKLTVRLSTLVEEQQRRLAQVEDGKR